MSAATESKKKQTAKTLQAMETLWQEFSRGNSKYPTPSWHFDELRHTENALKSGAQKFEDWSSAKAKILKRIR
jgi:hypothetical protein